MIDIKSFFFHISDADARKTKILSSSPAEREGSSSGSVGVIKEGSEGGGGIKPRAQALGNRAWCLK